MRYDHDMWLHCTDPNSPWQTITLDAIVLTRDLYVKDICEYASDPARYTGARYLAFDNEWNRMYPSRIPIKPPTPLDKLYDTAFEVIISAINVTPATHLRFIDFGLPYKLLDCIARQPRVTELHLVRCLPVVATTEDQLKSPHKLTATMANITVLHLGFPEDERYQARLWNIVALCPLLRHLYAYAATVDAVVEYPTRDICLRAPHINDLEILHIEGASNTLEELVDWSDDAYTACGTPGKWTSIKINSRLGMTLRDTHCFLELLWDTHQDVEILVLEGVAETPVELFEAIADRCPNLRGLGLVRRANAAQSKNRLCPWEEPIYSYASPMSRMTKLEHFSANFQWSPYTHGPSTLRNFESPVDDYEAVDASLDDAGTQYGIPDDFREPGLSDRFKKLVPSTQLQDIAQWIEPDEVTRNYETMNDAEFLVVPFMAACPAFKSFSIRADTVYMRCVVAQGSLGRDDIGVGLEGDWSDWNPPRGQTWGTDIV